MKNTSSFISHCAKISSGDIPNSDSIHWAGLLNATSYFLLEPPSTHPELPLEHSLRTLGTNRCWNFSRFASNPPGTLATNPAWNLLPCQKLNPISTFDWLRAHVLTFRCFMSSPPTGSHCPSPSWKLVLSELEKMCRLSFNRSAHAIHLQHLI